jgi:glycosyltransferase involved in cell wall biosynthesis
VKPRLLIVTEIIAPYRIPVFNALAARGDVDLHVLFLAETDPVLRHWVVYKKEISFSYEVLPSIRRRIGKHNLLLNRGVAEKLRRSRPDVILCGGYNYPASWQAAYWAKRHAIPLLLWIESTSADQRTGSLLTETLKRRFFRLCAGFVVPGKSSARYVSQFGVPDHRIVTSRNAIDLALFRHTAEQARTSPTLRFTLQLPPRYFLHVGRLVADKGVFDVLEAYAKLEERVRTEVGLVFVGEGMARNELETRARSVAPGIIQFRGFVQRDELPQYYALAEAMIFPTHSDTWGFVVNEAMACGLPVVATEVAGCVADLVIDHVTGLVIPSHNSIRVSEAMLTLADSPELRYSMGQQASRLISGYSPEAGAAGIAAAARIWGGSQ